MRQIQKEKITNITCWEAIDGTTFNDRNECEKYENSAYCVIRFKYKPLIVRTLSEEELFGVGCCDNMIDIIKIQDNDDINVIEQLYSVHYNRYDPEQLTKINKICKLALENNDFILVSTGYNDDSFYVIDTLTNKLNEILKKCDSEASVRIEDNGD